MRAGKMAGILAFLTVFCITILDAQVQADGDAPLPIMQEFKLGELKPSLWMGIKSIFSAGYNFETSAGGFRNLGGEDQTYAIFIIGMVDSKNTTKTFDTPKDIDRDTWNAKFKLMSFSERITSWGYEYRVPSWLAEIAGKGMHIGFFTQAGEMIGSMDDEIANNRPRLSIAAGDMVIPLGGTGDNDLGEIFYEKDDASNKTKYSTTNGAVWYTGYEQENLWNTYLTLLSEGNVNSDVRDGKNDGFAGVVDFEVSPLGKVTDEFNPFTITINGNIITGVNWENTTENVGYGLKVMPSIYLNKENFILSPVVAFDGKHDINNDFTWKFGGGLNFQFSNWAFTNDEWGIRRTLVNQSFRWVSDKIWQYAYAQVYGAYSEADDFDLMFMIEEPDGLRGFHDKLGGMLEFRIFNLTEKNKDSSWALQGRVSYDIESGTRLFTPYVRAYFDSDSVFKLRPGIHTNIIPNAGIELAYTSANLNPNANTTTKPGGLNFYDGIFDAGRIELIVILQSDDKRPHTPKRQDFWNYSKYQNGMTNTN